MRVTPFAGGSPRPSLPPGRSTSLPALATSSGPTAAAATAVANDGPRELFLAFYAMTHRDEPELVERVRQYVADGGDLNVRDKTGWGYLNVRSLPHALPQGYSHGHRVRCVSCRWSCACVRVVFSMRRSTIGSRWRRRFWNREQTQTWQTTAATRHSMYHTTHTHAAHTHTHTTHAKRADRSCRASGR
jgi:hypothetical protein